MNFDTRFWRQWHRWVSAPAAVFLCFAAVTGVIVACVEFFGPAEAQREALRKEVSTITTAAPPSELADKVRNAFARAQQQHPNAPVDKIEVMLKGAHPTVTLFTSKPTGGEDRQLAFDLRTGAPISDEAFVDKPFWYRLHSGEAFGDGGLVFAMIWGTALAVLSVTGLLVYGHMFLRMRHRGVEGVRRFFW